MAKRKPKNKGKPATKPPAIEKISEDVIAAAYSAATQPVLVPVFVKVCRLCESKDGPFLNIFDADKVTAKKIDDLMPFTITENDDLPHKICFRCSAKLEELYEFIQKCIKTQENLRTALGKSGPFLTKSKMRKKLWEDQLNKTNMSNDDICDALIKKAMEGIKSIPSTPIIEDVELPPETKRTTRSKEAQIPKKEVKVEKPDESDDIVLKQVKSTLDKSEPKPSKITRSSKGEAAQVKPNKIEEPIPENVTENVVEPQKTDKKKPKRSQSKNLKSQVNTSIQNEKKSPTKTKTSINNLSFDYEPDAPATEENESEKETKIVEEPPEDKKPFNIMDYISIIKVNGVGVLFQCKLCNRNFLKKEVVESHSCAKNGVPKVDLPKSVPAPEPPKVSTVKYIKIDSDMKKSLTEKTRLAEKSETEKQPIEENDLTQDDAYELPPKVKSKPKAGPASKTKRNTLASETVTPQAPVEPPITNQPTIPTTPSLQFPCMPNLNSRFKIVPGPNNMFTLVEDTSNVNSQAPLLSNMLSAVHNLPMAYGQPQPQIPIGYGQPHPQIPIGYGQQPQVPSVHNISLGYAQPPPLFQAPPPILAPQPVQPPPPIQEPTKSSRKRKSAEVHNAVNANNVRIEPEVIDLEDQSKPYPVGLFQTHSQATPATFTTPAMKKQSYTVVQTGNPSKLLISTKARAAEVELSKKRPRKTKAELRENSESKEPYTVTLEDVAPPKDNFFTFINVDPLLQPSYVLPTDNIIQESQISTSSSVLRAPVVSKEKDKYSCNMCEETFSREKKLLAHIQSHYTKMDEEDQMRAEKSSRKRGKK